MAKKILVEIEAVLKFEQDELYVDEFIQKLQEAGVAKIKDIKMVSEKECDAVMNSFYDD
jgi:hypothetical protein